MNTDRGHVVGGQQTSSEASTVPPEGYQPQTVTITDPTGLFSTLLLTMGLERRQKLWPW